MELIAKKPCSFGGKKFFIGDVIPGELVLDPKMQEKRGLLTIVNDSEPVSGVDHGDPSRDSSLIAVVLHAEEGDYPLSLTPEGLQSVVDVLTTKGDAAKAIVEQMTDEHSLILLDATDSRANIRKAAQARAMALNDVAPPTAEEETPEESAGDQ